MFRSAWMTMTTFLIVLCSAGTVFAAGEMGSQEKGAVPVTVVAVTTNMLHSAKNFIGTEVRDNAGQKVGEIQDLAFDFDRGLGYAVVSSDQALNIDKTFMVPLRALTSDHQGEYVTMTVSREQLAAMPKKETGMTDEEYVGNLYDFYGMSTPWENLPGDVPATEKSIPGSNLTYPGPREVVPGEKEVVPSTPPGGTMDRQR